MLVGQVRGDEGVQNGKFQIIIVQYIYATPPNWCVPSLEICTLPLWRQAKSVYFTVIVCTGGIGVAGRFFGPGWSPYWTGYLNGVVRERLGGEAKAGYYNSFHFVSFRNKKKKKAWN